MTVTHGRLAFHASRRSTAILLAALLLGIWADQSTAQEPQRRQLILQGGPVQIQAGGVAMAQPRGAESLEDVAIFRSDREPMLWLRNAEKLLAERRYGEAVRFLGRILDSEEDFFFQPDEDKPVYRSLKSEAQRLIGRMSEAGRQSYELQYGAEARKRLSDAAANGRIDEVAAVARGMFHTQAGYDATYLLGTYYLNHERPLAAALCFQRLLDTPTVAKRLEPALSIQLATCWVRAGMPAEAERRLAELRAVNSDAKIQIAGRTERLFDDDEKALQWLSDIVGTQQRRAPVASDQWIMFRGGPSRNAMSHGSTPLLEAQWRVPTTIDPHVEKMLDQLQSAYRDRQIVAIPSLSPLVVNDVVLMRTTVNLLAVDFRTGKRLWEVPLDEETEQWLSGSMASQPTAQGASLAAAGLDQRLWEDSTYGTLSSDARLVFSIEDLSISPAVPQIPNQRVVILPNGRRTAVAASAKPYNRLAAHEIRTGKLAWELGGADGDAHGGEQSGIFFLGPPLPLEDKLYVLADSGGEIRLLVLDPANGAVLWSQQLAIVERDILQDPARGRTGASPSYADGILVCPTSAGAVVALDLTTRSLLWGYRYPRSGGNMAMMGARLRGVMFAQRGQSGAGNWTDASVTIADGQVLLTPVESGELHCLNLLDGTLNWKIARDDHLYLAGVLDGVVYLVGSNQLSAVSLADGQPVWKPDQGALPEGSSPSGRGFLSEGRYYLPLTSGEVVTFDLSTGQIVGRSTSRKGDVPGNLVSYRGAIISQGVDRVERFHQRTALEQQVASRLSHNPDDATALALRAEIHLDAGRLPQAIADLRSAFQQDPDPRTRQLLVDGLLAALASDFATHRAAASEIEALIERSEDRMTFWRLMARGLAASGQHIAALERYLKLVDMSQGNLPLDEIESGFVARRDRWLRGELTALRQLAKADERRTMNAAIDARFDRAIEDGSVAALRHVLGFFGDHARAIEARQQLAEALVLEGAYLEAELELLRLEQSRDPATSNAATARLALLLHDLGREDDAASYFSRLRGQLNKVVCLNGKTGGQLFAALAPEDPVRRRVEQPATWPDGAVEKVRGANRSTVYRFFSCDLLGSAEPFFSGKQIQLDQGRSTLVARDGFGRELWSVSLAESGAALAINPGVVHAKVEGHLLLVSAGHTTFAIDTLLEGGGARVLWSRGLSEVVPGVPLNTTVHAGQIALPWGGHRVIVNDAYGQRTGLLGNLTSDYACLTQDRELTALDPLTGEVLWRRGDIPPGVEVFGDDELLFAAASDGSEAYVLRPLDGHLVGRRQVPASGARMTSLGRQLLLWKAGGNTSAIELFDPWSGKTVWQRKFARAANEGPPKATLIGQEAVAVVEASGRFSLFDLPSGRTLIDAPIGPEPQVEAIYVLPSRDQYTLVVSRTWRNNRNGIYISSVPGGTNNPLIDGRVYGFDRTSGKLVWEQDVETQGLLLDQPAELPVLVFASRVYQRGIPGRPQSQTFYPVLCLDKRTGAVLHEERVASHFGSFEVSGDPDNHQVALRLLRESIQMTFTDRPIEGNSPVIEMDNPEADDEASARRAPPVPAGLDLERVIGEELIEDIRQRVRIEVAPAGG